MCDPVCGTLGKTLGLEELQDIDITFLPPKCCERHGQGGCHITEENHYRKNQI